MRRLTSVKAETKPNTPVKPKIVVKVDPNKTVKQKVNLKKSISVTKPAQQKQNTLNGIERSVSVHAQEIGLENKKFLKCISLNNGSSIQNRISKKQPIGHLDDSFWSNGSVSRNQAASIDYTLYDDPDWYDDYVAFHKENFDSFLKATEGLGGDVASIGKLVGNAFSAHKDVVTIAARNGRPSGSDLPTILIPLSNAITAVQEFRDANRKSAQFNHLSALSEAIPFLGWVSISPKPGQYVGQMEESAQFYTNKVLKEFKESDPKQADWARSLIKLLKATTQHVKDNHGTGLQWNKDKPAATGATKAGGAPSAGGAPPPPPPAAAPPPPPPAPAGGSSGASEEVDRSQLFAALNKGGAVTSGLKKVTNDMKTHKNPALRNQGPVAAAKASSSLSPRPYSPPKFKKFNAPEVKKPPKFELQDKKWIIEHQDGNQNLVIDRTNDKQAVYMYKCKNSVLQVQGKINSIVLDNCVKCGVVFTDLISTCEFINCQSVKAQANGYVPTISIDKTDGCQVFLNEKNLDVQIISAKSSEMNICINNEDGDLNEFPLPEQYKTVWDGKKFVTTVMDLNL